MKIGSNEYVTFNHKGWHGWVTVDYAEAFADIDSWLDSPERKVVLQAPCRIVARHSLNGNIVYSKLMRAQNDGAYTHKECFSWIKWAIGPSRAVNILKTTSAMLARGHLCPRTLLGARKFSKKGWHLNLMVNEEIAFPTVEDIIQKGNPNAAEVIRQCGRQLAILHKDNFIHGDYLPRNTCFDFSTCKVIYLDNDKTSHWLFRPPFFLQRRNLEQFAYNLLLQGGLETCHKEMPADFINAYAAEMEWTKDKLDDVTALVMNKSIARWENKRKRK